MGRNQVMGRKGEQFAAEFLESAGWRILDRNWRSGRAEVDLVAFRAPIVAFVEVKTRSQSGCGHPLESITSRKRREIEGVAGAWIRERGRMLTNGFQVRFDAISITSRSGHRPTIDHVPDAWRPGDT